MERDSGKIVWPEGLKKTKPREVVLSILEQSKEPLTAMEISSKIEKTGKSVWLSTIYRVLESFEEKAIVQKTTVLDNGMAVYAINRHEHTHYAVCMKCRKMVAIENCPMQAFMPELEGQGFQVTGHKVEMYGFCKECSVQKKE